MCIALTVPGLFQPTVLLIAGPKSSKAEEPTNENQKRTHIPVLIGYHSVPMEASANLVPGNGLYYKKPKQIAGEPKKEYSPKTHNLTNLYETVKNNHSLLFTILASVLIPVGFIFIFFFEVTFVLSFKR